MKVERYLYGLTKTRSSSLNKRKDVIEKYFSVETVVRSAAAAAARGETAATLEKST